MSIVLTTASKEKILINDVPLGKGGEGSVHRIISPPAYNKLCVKMYFQQYRTNQREQKIQFMIHNPPPGSNMMSGRYIICWPKEVVYENNQFAGFIMPMAFDESLLLYELCMPKLKKTFGMPWHTKYDRTSRRGIASRLKLCVNIASAINALHNMGRYVFVDLKPQNVLVTDSGQVSLIDLDSIQITLNNNLVFPAQVATPEYVPIEGNYLNPAKDLIYESWDNFSLAVIFYELLFGLHPYAASFQGQYQDSSTIADSIKSGLFVFGSKRSYVYSRPALHDNFNRIPSSLQTLFLKAFDGGNSNPDLRPKAEEWGRTIFSEIEKPSRQMPGFAYTRKPTVAVTPPRATVVPPPVTVAPPRVTAAPPPVAAAPPVSTQSNAYAYKRVNSNISRPSVHRRSRKEMPGWVAALAIAVILITLLLIIGGAVSKFLSSGSNTTQQNCILYNDDPSQNEVNIRMNCDTKPCSTDPTTLAGTLPNNTPVKLNDKVKPVSSGRYTWVQVVIPQTGRTVWVASTKIKCN